jgi:peptidoglycan/xylan/chitin deacetylase (PgdA/CDA1 family)
MMFSPGLKRSVGTILTRLGFLGAYAFLRSKYTGSQVAIIFYHKVSARKDCWSVEALDPDIFEGQIRYLCRNYRILSLRELLASLNVGELPKKKAVAITFDDGYKDNYLHAYPILRKYHVPATIFLASGSIGGRDLFWWDKVGYAVWHAGVRQIQLAELGNYQLESDIDRRHAALAILERLKGLPDWRKNLLIRELINRAEADIPDGLGEQLILSWEEVIEMSRNGIDFGAHTVTHPILLNLPTELARWEIAQSKKDVETRIGKRVHFFAYPDGQFNAQIADMVREVGFIGACAAYPSWISSTANPYELGRIAGCEDHGNEDVFKFLLSGLWRDVQSALGGRKSSGTDRHV